MLKPITFEELDLIQWAHAQILIHELERMLAEHAERTS